MVLLRLVDFTIRSDYGQDAEKLTLTHTADEMIVACSKSRRIRLSAGR
jgi:hypothetical protein